MKKLFLLFVFLLFAAVSFAQDITGDWNGTLHANGGELRLVLHISKNSDGSLKATLDSVDQGANGIPVSSATLKDSKLSLDVQAVHGMYEGKVNADASEIAGTWRQGGKSFPLTFTRVKSASELGPRPRPQNPVKPYPYREEEVSYKNPAANIQLAGTMTIPSGQGRFPAVLLMQGSGPHDRDETIFGHKPFLVLADYLTRRGIVVLRADKRGIGKSAGDYAKVVIQDFASDADAGVAYLKTRPEVDPHKIGLIGHSEGGVEAPMAAAHNPEVRFVVMMAGMGVPGDQLLPEQLRLIEQAAGASADAIEKDVAMERELLAAVERDKDDAVLQKELREKLTGKLSNQQLDAQFKMVSSPWFRSLLEYDPAATLVQVTCPVLALNGDKDLQVPPQQNLPPIRKALAAGGNNNYEIDELPGLNHLFQTAKTGAISEYGEIEETMSPVAMEKVASWILKQTEKSMAKTVAQ